MGVLSRLKRDGRGTVIVLGMIVFLSWQDLRSEEARQGDVKESLEIKSSSSALKTKVPPKIEAGLTGRDYYLRGQWLKAKALLSEELKEIKEVKKKGEYHFYLGNLFVLEKKYSLASGHYQKAIQYGLTGPTLYAYYGHLKLKQKEYDVAEAFYEKSIGMSKGYGAAIEGLAHAFFGQKKYFEAADQLEKLLQIEGEHPKRTVIILLIERLRKRAEQLLEQEKQRKLIAEREAKKRLELDKNKLKLGRESKSKKEDSIKEVEKDLDIID